MNGQMSLFCARIVADTVGRAAVEEPALVDVEAPVVELDGRGFDVDVDVDDEEEDDGPLVVVELVVVVDEDDDGTDSIGSVDEAVVDVLVVVNGTVVVVAVAEPSLDSINQIDKISRERYHQTPR